MEACSVFFTNREAEALGRLVLLGSTTNLSLKLDPIVFSLGYFSFLLVILSNIMVSVYKVSCFTKKL